jgi:hypothetical protein
MNPKARDYIRIKIVILDWRKSKCSVALPLFRRGFHTRFQFFHPLRRERFLEEVEIVPVKLKKPMGTIVPQWTALSWISSRSKVFL